MVALGLFQHICKELNIYVFLIFYLSPYVSWIKLCNFGYIWKIYSWLYFEKLFYSCKYFFKKINVVIFQVRYKNFLKNSSDSKTLIKCFFDFISCLACSWLIYKLSIYIFWKNKETWIKNSQLGSENFLKYMV